MHPRLLVSMLLLAIATLTASAHAEDSEAAWVAQLESPDPGERAEAASELGEDGDPSPTAVASLLRAAHAETNHRALREMLLTLGHSGMTEALGLIQTHAMSPAEDVRKVARKALRRWLVVNDLLNEDAGLPDPPHAFYDSQPELPPTRPGGHSLAAWVQHLPHAPPPSEATTPAPVYLEPSPDGLMPGHGVEEFPRWGLVAAGSSVFGALYAATTVTAFAASQEVDAAFVPVFGPLFPAIDLFAAGDSSGMSSMLGAILFLDTIGQGIGIGMIIAGATGSNQQLIRVNDHVAMDVTPRGFEVSLSF